MLRCLKMKMKYIFILFILFLFNGCENSNMTKYIESYNSDLQYGNINELEDNSDRKIVINNVGVKLKVALFVPLSGPAQIVGESILNAAELSLFQNKKNNIVMMIYDTKGTTFGAVEAMNQAVKDGINVIIGPLLYSETKAISEIAIKNNIIVFSLSNEEKLKNIDNIFVAGSIPEQEIELLTSTLINNEMTNFIAYLPNNSFGSYINDVLKNKLKAKEANLIKVDFYNKEDKAFDAKLLSLMNSYKITQEALDKYKEKKANKNEVKKDFIISDEDKLKPQVLFLAEGGKVVENIGMSIYKNRNALQNQMQLTGMTKLEGDVDVLKNPYLDGIIYVGSNIEKYNEFEKLYNQQFNMNPIKISTIVVDLISVLDQFYVEKSGVYYLDKEKLLYPFGYEGIDGRFRFLPNGLIERNMFILQIQNKQKVLINTNQEFLNY